MFLHQCSPFECAAPDHDIIFTGGDQWDYLSNLSDRCREIRIREDSHRPPCLEHPTLYRNALALVLPEWDKTSRYLRERRRFLGKRFCYGLKRIVARTIVNDKNLCLVIDTFKVLKGLLERRPNSTGLVVRRNYER